MNDLFLITGILFFVTQTLYTGIALWRDVNNVRTQKEITNHQRQIMDTYNWTVEWVKGANERFAYLSDAIYKLKKEKE